MKLAFIAASIAATANIQALKLGATCQAGTDAVENLVIEIPYPDERTAKLLSLEAGDCDVNNYGGSMTWAAGVATLLIPIDACAMRGELYGTPVVARSYGLYRPTATVTFGHKMGDVDVVFRTLPIAAECGKKTSYTVEFNYNNVTSADTEGCTLVDGVCVFPAYGDDAKFEIKEYTDDNFNVEVDENTRARFAGNPIHLSMRVTGLAEKSKFAVTKCKIVDGDKELVLLNPGAESNPSCEMNEIGLSAKYELNNGDFVFNFQHILFLLRKTQQESTSTFSLQCSVEICEKTDASSKCNQAAAVCSDSAVEKKSYMCTGLCNTDAECSINAGVPSCPVCTCDNGDGATGDSCPADGSAFCASCTGGYELESGVCSLSGVDGTLIMKLGLDDTFGYTSSYWTNDNLLNENSASNVEENAKYATFLNTRFNNITVCLESETENCYSHKFANNKIWNNAKELFSAGYVREDLDVHAIVAAHKAVGLKDFSQYEKNCPMQVPGFNTQGNDNCKARFGWCWNTHDQECQGQSADSDNSMGIGLYSQTDTAGAPGVGAGWTWYTYREHDGRKRAWVYVSLV